MDGLACVTCIGVYGVDELKPAAVVYDGFSFCMEHLATHSKGSSRLTASGAPNLERRRRSDAHLVLRLPPAQAHLLEAVQVVPDARRLPLRTRPQGRLQARLPREAVRVSTPSSYRFQPGDQKSVVIRHVIRLGDTFGTVVIHDRLLVDDEVFCGPAVEALDWSLKRLRELGTTIVEIDDTGPMSAFAEEFRKRAPAQLQITTRRRADLLASHGRPGRGVDTGS